MSDVTPSAKKRLMMDAEKNPQATLDNALVLSDKNSISSGLDTEESELPLTSEPLATPQKSQNKKKLKANDGAAIDTKENETLLDVSAEPSMVDTPIVDRSTSTMVEDNAANIVSSKAGANSPSPGSAGPQEGSVREQ